jgi:hypothetical protein
MPPAPAPGVSGPRLDVSILSTKQRHSSRVQVAWASRKIHPVRAIRPPLRARGVIIVSAGSRRLATAR